MISRNREVLRVVAEATAAIAVCVGTLTVLMLPVISSLH